MTQTLNSVIGVDEVGRGALIAPVVAAAVILPDPLPEWVAEVRDSKKLSAKKRERLSNLIMSSCLYSIKEVSVEIIDQINILYASLFAMKLAIDEVYSLSPPEKKPIRVLVDGNNSIPTDEGWLELPLEQILIVNGDNLEKSIGAASIIAKVYRDKLMEEYDLLYPHYNLRGNKGYGTREHCQAIAKYGLTPEHRKSFSGIYKYVQS